MRRFISELQRRNVLRVAAFYAGGGWLLVQVATQVFPFYDLPAWSVRLVISIVLIGFPFALLFSWFYELTPEGLKLESEIDHGESITRQTGKTLDRWIIAVLSLAVVVLLANYFVRREPAAAAAEKSIAVLPLSNASGDPANEYFSDGLSEDLINALGQIGNLRVISRYSSFQFKGKTDDAKSIGGKLGVTSLLGGSVRRQGERVRIVAELIKVADGSQLWSRTYDRELKDIFAVQAEIAQAVAEALKIKLLGSGGAGIVVADRPPSGDLKAYEAYLQGSFHHARHGADDLRKAVIYYREAIGLDPNYALALAGMAGALSSLGGQTGGQESADAYAESRKAVDQALVLNPDLADAHYAKGWLMLNADWNLPGAQIEFQRAQDLDPTGSSARNGLATVLANQGQYEAALAPQLGAIAVDPLRAGYRNNLAALYISLSRYDEAEAAVRKVLELKPQFASAHMNLAYVAVMRGDKEIALREAELEAEPGWKAYALTLARQMGDDRSAADAALQAMIAEHAEDSSFQIATVYAYRKDADKAFEWLERAAAQRDAGVSALLQEPILLRLKADPRFAAFCKKVGLPVPV